MKHSLSAATVATSRRLRREMTDAERIIWRMLREHFKEWHFRRQVPIGPYFADFASHRAKLVIEIDGGQQNESMDAARSKRIESQGYQVIRFWNHDVLGNLEGVYLTLSAAISHPTPGPSPSRGGE